MNYSGRTMRRRRGTSSVQSKPWIQSGFVKALNQKDRRRGREGGRSTSYLPCLFAIVLACLVLVRLRWTATNSAGGGTSARTPVTLDGVAYEFCGGCLYHRKVGSCEKMAKKIVRDREEWHTTTSLEEAMVAVITLAEHCGEVSAENAAGGEEMNGGVAIATEQTVGSKVSDGGGWGTLVTLDGVTYQFCRECLYHSKVGSCEARATWLMEKRSISVEEAMRDAIKNAKECGRESLLLTVNGVSHEFCPECEFEFKGKKISCQQRVDLMMQSYNTPRKAAMESAVRQIRECGKTLIGVI